MEHSKKGRARRKNPLDPTIDGKRRATIMKRVHMARKRGERIQVMFDEKGQSEAKHGDELMSWIGFKKIEKWERRDGLWLEQQTGTDGELKDPACKKMEYNTQESQGIFESVGTSDVLSQALSRPEHKGRVCGQFVKPSQYFNLNQSSSKDNEVLSMRREIEELKALLRGLCANKYVEPSVDPNNVAIVDQHNSFKASCSAHEKQHGDSDPPTMPVDSQECKLYIFDEVQGGQLFVAFGRAWLESLPTDTVHGIPLGEGNVRVSINVPKLKNHHYLYRRTRQPLWRMLLMGNQIEVPIPYTIMTFEIPIFLSFEDIYEFINLQEIGANCVLVYMRYLEELCRINGQAEKFVFVSSTLISPVRIDTEDAGMRERANSLISFLRDAPKGRLYLVPHNRGSWVLGVIDPWEDLVLYFDHLREKKRDDFTELMNMALSDWKIMDGEGIRRRRDCKTKISNLPCPLQEGSVECGFGFD
ncbi:hypothetical protein TIFTF001_035206 [Ficus carica]|uniref:Uncharacterized protein n=1 Tax=Ficus carica TaxID=3494 RepID=A0AA88E1W1_FICCA|nr:hypothetical protein TIFTF001_035206 [Ficus carica]